MAIPLSPAQQQFVSAVQLLQQKNIEEGERLIMGMRKYLKEFLETTFILSTDTNLQINIYTRQVASVEFKNELDQHIKEIDQTLFLQLLGQIIPAGAAAAKAYSDQAIMNNLAISFEKLYEYLVQFHQRYTGNFQDLATQLFNSICESMDMSSIQQTEFSIRVFVSFIKKTQLERVNEFREAATLHYFRSYLQSLLIYFIEMPDLHNFSHPKLVLQLTRALRCIFEPREMSNLYSIDDLASLPVLVTQLFRKLRNPDSFVYQNAKEDCCFIIYRYVNKIRKIHQMRLQSESNERFAQTWLEQQKEIATVLLEDINQCQTYDLFADYDSINSVFQLAGELIEKNNILEQFYHPEAATVVLQNGQTLVQNVIQMIINAANVRMEHFKHDDLLVIDCLRPSVDLIRQICLNNSQIEDALLQQAQDALGGFMTGSLQQSDYQNQEVEARIFLGVLLIRRGLPKVSNSIKAQLCLQGLQNCKFVHEIVFEEIAKLIIQVTYDDYSQQNFQYVSNCTFEQAIHVLNQPNQDVVPYIIDLMVQLYCSDIPGNFQYRMLSGILSRPVRYLIIPPEIIERLLKQSIFIMYNNTNQTQHGGMVTLSKTCLAVLTWEQVDNVLCDLIVSPPFRDLPSLLQQSPNNILVVENAFNIISMILANQSTFSNRFECLMAGLVTQLLQINFELSQTLFSNLNQLMDREIVHTQPQYELLDQIILGLAGLPESRDMYNCFQHTLSYIKFVLPRHLQVMSANGNYETSIFTLINNLVGRRSLIAQSFACYLMANLLDIAMRQMREMSYQLLSKFLPHFIAVFSQDFKTLCNITKDPQNIQAINNYIEPESKRMCLFYLSYFYFVFLGTVALVNQDGMISNLPLGSATGQTTGITCIFTATWALQDCKQAYGSAWRRTLAQYILAATEPLMTYYGQNISVVWPCLLWARYTCVQQYDYAIAKPPQIEFDLLQTTTADLATVQVVFDNLYSKALLHAQQVDNIDCPFWNRNEASYFGEALKILSTNHEEKSTLIEIVGRQVLLSGVNECLKRIDLSQFPQSYQEYIARVRQEGVIDNGMENIQVRWV